MCCNWKNLGLVCSRFNKRLLSAKPMFCWQADRLVVDQAEEGKECCIENKYEFFRWLNFQLLNIDVMVVYFFGHLCVVYSCVDFVAIEISFKSESTDWRTPRRSHNNNHFSFCSTKKLFKLSILSQCIAIPPTFTVVASFLLRVETTREEEQVRQAHYRFYRVGVWRI